MAKDGFVIYKSFYKPISGMSDEQLGRLFRAIYEYQLNGTTEVDSDIAMPFSFFQNRFEDDTKKYETTCKRRSESGKKGAEAKSKQLLAIANTQAIASNCYQMLAIATDRIGKDRIGLDRIGEDRIGNNIDVVVNTPIAPSSDAPTTTANLSDIESMCKECEDDINGDTQYSEEMQMKFKKTKSELVNSLSLFRQQLILNDEHQKFTRRSFRASFVGYLQKREQEQTASALGVGEYIKDGRRTYGNGEATVPMSAPKRPSSRYYWNSETNDWSM